MWDFDAICYHRDRWSGVHDNTFFAPLWANHYNHAFIAGFVGLWDSLNADIFSRLNSFELEQRKGPAAEAFSRSAEYNNLRWLEGVLHAATMADFYASWFEERREFLDGLMDEYREILLSDTLAADSSAADSTVTDSTGGHVRVEENLSKVVVCANGRRIIVRGTDAETRVFVFDITGRNLYRGPAARMPAMPAPGIYIVRVSGRSYKVAIK